MRRFISSVLPLTVIWAQIVGSCAILFLVSMYNDGTSSVNFPEARQRASFMVRPGPWNGGQPWSQEEADAYVRRHAQQFWSEVWSRGSPYLAAAGVILVVGWWLIGVDPVHQTGEGTFPSSG